VVFAAGREDFTQRSYHPPEITFGLDSYLADVLQQGSTIIALVQGHCPMYQVYQKIVGSIANVLVGFNAFFKSAQGLLVAVFDENMLGKEFGYIDTKTYPAEFSGIIKLTFSKTV
jgi:hypothetical protein